MLKQPFASILTLRRCFLLAAFFFVASAHLLAADRPSKDADRPNILFCFSDDWGRYASIYRDPNRPDELHFGPFRRMARARLTPASDGAGEDPAPDPSLAQAGA